jgi:hypothetical protein
MDPIFASTLSFFGLLLVAFVAITYRQKDIAALALKALAPLRKSSNATQDEKKKKEVKTEKGIKKG